MIVASQEKSFNSPLYPATKAQRNKFFSFPYHKNAIMDKAAREVINQGRVERKEDGKGEK